MLKGDVTLGFRDETSLRPLVQNNTQRKSHFIDDCGI